MIVEPYNLEWPRRFLQLQSFLHRNLVDTHYAIEHVGSTSVPGMTAKPIIDIDIVQRDGKFEQVKKRLMAAGYEYEGDQGIAGRESFNLNDAGLKDTLPEHHLYVCAADADELHRHRAFRDFMLVHPEWVEKLSAHKQELAVKLGDDRKAYQDAKAPMVEQILALALQEAPLP